MSRQPVQYDPQAPRLSVTARRLDTFTAPTRNQIARPSETNNLSRLAQALDVVGGNLTNTLSQEQEAAVRAQREEEVKQAQADLTKSGKSLEEAVKAGVIPAEATPIYKSTYKQSWGKLQARTTYNTFLQEKLSDAGLANQEFGSELEVAQAVEDFLLGARQEFLASEVGDDANALSGFGQLAPSIEGGVASTVAQQRLQANEDKFIATTHGHVNATLADPEATPENIAAQLDVIGKESIGTFGMSGSDFNVMVTGQIEATAKELALSDDYERAEELLEAGSKVPTGNGYLGGTTKFKDARNRAVDYIERQERDDLRWQFTQENQTWARESREQTRTNWERSEEEYQRAAETRQTKALVKAASSEVTWRILNDPTQIDFADTVIDPVSGEEVPADEKLRILYENDPDKVRTLRNFREQVLNEQRKVIEDTDWVSGEVSRMMEDPSAYDPQRLIDGVNQEKIDVPRMMQMWGEHRSVAQYADHPFLKGSVWKTIKQGLESSIRGNLMDASGSAMFDATVGASVELQQYASEWLTERAEKGQTPNRAEFNTEMRKFASDLFQHYNAVGADVSKYVRDQKTRPLEQFPDPINPAD